VITISEVSRVDDATVAAVSRLLPQLSRSSAAPTAAELTELVASPATTLLAATADDGTIVGMLTLALFRIPTGVRAWIEDVVVDDAARGSGAATALTHAALDAARAAGAKTVELTSRPSREAANRLYQRIGFEARETNVYRFTL
jgi:ribosomal protein S18 acetylase RimI-like enzyme